MSRSWVITQERKFWKIQNLEWEVEYHNNSPFRLSSGKSSNKITKKTQRTYLPTYLLANPSHHKNFWLFLSSCLYLTSVIELLQSFHVAIFYEIAHMCRSFSPSLFRLPCNGCHKIKADAFFSGCLKQCPVSFSLLFLVLSSRKLLENSHRAHYLLNVQTTKH